MNFVQFCSCEDRRLNQSRSTATSLWNELTLYKFTFNYHDIVSY